MHSDVEMSIWFISRRVAVAPRLWQGGRGSGLGTGRSQLTSGELRSRNDLSKSAGELQKKHSFYFQGEWEKVRCIWGKMVRGVMIFREEVVQNKLWHIFTSFAIFSVFVA